MSTIVAALGGGATVHIVKGDGLLCQNNAITFTCPMRQNTACKENLTQKMDKAALMTLRLFVPQDHDWHIGAKFAFYPQPYHITIQSLGTTCFRACERGLQRASFVPQNCEKHVS